MLGKTAKCGRSSGGPALLSNSEFGDWSLVEKNQRIYNFQSLRHITGSDQKVCGAYIPPHSLRASFPERSGGGAGKGRRTCNYVSGI